MKEGPHSLRVQVGAVGALQVSRPIDNILGDRFDIQFFSNFCCSTSFMRSQTQNSFVLPMLDWATSDTMAA